MAAHRTYVIVLPGDARRLWRAGQSWGPGPRRPSRGLRPPPASRSRTITYASRRRSAATSSAGGTTRTASWADGATSCPTLPYPVAGLTRGQDQGAGRSSACASNLTGTTWCWGQNMGGQLGNGTTTSSSQPVKVLPGPAGIVLHHRSARLSAYVGTVSCWGTGACGDGGGPSSVRSTPTRVAPERPSSGAEPAGGDATSMHGARGRFRRVLGCSTIPRSAR